MQQYILTYLIIINLITFLTYGSDKKRAIKKQWRIPEKTLLLLAVSGGSPAALFAMQIFRHKTRKMLFKMGVPCILLLQAGAAAVLLL